MLPSAGGCTGTEIQECNITVNFGKIHFSEVKKRDIVKKKEREECLCLVLVVPEAAVVAVPEVPVVVAAVSEEVPVMEADRWEECMAVQEAAMEVTDPLHPIWEADTTDPTAAVAAVAAGL